MFATLLAVAVIGQFGPAQQSIGVPRLPYGGVALGVTMPRSGSLADGSGIESAPYYVAPAGVYDAKTNPGHWVVPADAGPSGIPYGMYPSVVNPAGLVPQTRTDLLRNIRFSALVGRLAMASKAH
jgi:hypothetical protein